MLVSIPDSTATELVPAETALRDVTIVFNPTGSGTTVYISQRSNVGVDGFPLAEGESVALPRIMDRVGPANKPVYCYQASGGPVNVGYEVFR